MTDTSTFGGFGSTITQILAGDILASARTHLDDDDATIWTDHRLMPKLREAFRELMIHLTLNDYPLVDNTNIVLVVPAGTTDLSTLSGYPTDMVEPQVLKERVKGGREVDLREMVETGTLPDYDPIDSLNYWNWGGNLLTVLPARTDRELKINYMRGLKAPNTVTDPVSIIFGDTYLSYRTAAIALGSLSSIGKADLMKVNRLQAQAETNLYTVLKVGAKDSLPTRRRPYHRKRLPKMIGVFTSPGTGSQVTIPEDDVAFQDVILATYDMATSSYLASLASAPKGKLMVFLNGILQTPSVDYSLTLPSIQLAKITFLYALTDPSTVTVSYVY